MSPLRILVLGSYPAVNPRHGGQIRLSQIVSAYRARGHLVKHASFFPAHDFYTQSTMGPLDVPLPVEPLHEWRGRTSHFVEDLRTGEVAAQGDHVAALASYSGPADIVHLEQPWLMPVVRKMRESNAIGPFRLVYGSQNIEHRLKRAILRDHHAPEEEAVAMSVLALERECAEAAAVVAAVASEDAQALAEWTRSPLVVAGNGVAPWRSDEGARAQWRERLGSDPFALYVASSHPPNILGFCESFGPSLAGLSPIQKVVVVGHVCGFLTDTPWFKRWQSLNEGRLVPLGVLAQDALSAVRDLAHSYVLPVTSGGGSNLKTAEALYAGRHVVATQLALRGFESLCDLPGVRIAEPGAQFAAAVAQSLEQPLPADDAAAAARRAALTWAHTLAPLCEAIER